MLRLGPIFIHTRFKEVQSNGGQRVEIIADAGFIYDRDSGYTDTFEV